MTRVILASASPRRRELLVALLPAFEVLPADVDEPLGGDPCENALTLARLKADAVAEQHPGAVVIGSDTIVHDGRVSFGKPADAADATRMLRALRARDHVVATGVALARDSQTIAACSQTVVRLAALRDSDIAAYVASGRPLDKAGAYAIQDEDVPTVASWAGCYCGVMGLPLWTLRKLLAASGVPADEPSATFARCETCPERSGTLQ